MGTLDRRHFLESIAKSAVGGAILGLGKDTLWGQVPPAPPSNLRVVQGGTANKAVLQPSDFSCLGAFTIAPGGDPNFAGTLALRYVGGQPRLYSMSIGSGGRVNEFSVPSDNALRTAAPFPAAALTYDFGDIYQQALYSTVDKGYGTPPFTGLASGISPNGLFWDEIDRRMYWTYTSGYNNTSGVSDTVVGYSTLNDATHTGTGVGMWKLVPPSAGNNRWVNGLVSIPPDYAALFGGRRLGVGFGGFYSIASNGPVSAGPALYAVDPAGFTAAMNRNYAASTPLKLMLHKFGTDVSAGYHRPPRHASLQCLDMYDEGAFKGQTNVWNWSDKPPSAVWIDTGSKHGFIVFALLSGGNVQTNVLSASGSLACQVADASGLHVGDFVQVQTVNTAGQSEYPFAVGSVASIAGNNVTFGFLENGWPSGTSNVGAARVGGTVVSGAFYQGGGNCASCWWTPWYIYDPSDLAAVAQGTKQPDLLVPTSMANYPLPHVERYPIPGGGPDQIRPCLPNGAAYDPATKRLYVLYGQAYQNAVNDDRPLVYVFHVNS